MLQPLFPPYLNKGSQGPAVVFLQYLLMAMGFVEPGMVPDGDYGEKTAASVRYLQVYLGFDVNERDGNFGPATRTRLTNSSHINVDAIKVVYADFLDRTFYYAPGTEELLVWPPFSPEEESRAVTGR